MSYSKLILKDQPDIIWPFDDLAESSSISYAINFFTSSVGTYAASVDASSTNLVQIPIIFGGGTALYLTSSSTPGISIPALNRFSELYKSKQYAIEFWLQIDSVLNREIALVKKRNFTNVGLFLKENYLIYRYGNSSSYAEVRYGLGELNEPTHIVMNYNNGSIELLVNGVSTITRVDTNQILSADPSYADNDFFDFYGNPEIKIVFDAVAIYPFTLSQNRAKKHYVYGLGRGMDENIFFNLGGNYYNFSTKVTRKSYYDYWSVPEDWRLTNVTNLVNTNIGVFNVQYGAPVIESLDGNITKSNDQILFGSSSSTNGSYIDIKNITSMVKTGLEPFFIKVTFNGSLPTSGSYQTIMSYAEDPFNDLIQFNLKNTSGSYYVNVLDVRSASSLSFYVPSITSSPTAYIGMKYSDQAVFYFALSGSPVQSASFTNYSGSVYGVDLFSDYFPPKNNNVLRIGSNYSYNTILTASTGINQFNGTFHKFIVASSNFSASVYNDIDSYRKYIYAATYNSSLDRFKISSYGNLNFILHGARISERNTSGSYVISSNRFEFGYPDVLSGSQVYLYVTMYDYSGSVIQPKTQLQKVNSLEWLNLKDISSRYLSFDIDIIGEDIQYFPPTVKYFKGEAYPYTGSYTDVFDDGGDKIRIRNNASAQAYLPEFYETPSIFLTQDSGVKVYRSLADIEFRPEKIGTVGFYIKFNEAASAALKFFEVFTSSAASVSLFSASTSSTNLVSLSSSSAKYYLNGASATTIYSDNWAHVTFTFNPKIQTSSVNNFLIRFGETSKSNFNIQNIYILETLLPDEEILYIHNAFTGGSAMLAVGDSSSASIKIFDKNETSHSSSVTGYIYQPYLTQNRFLCDVVSAIDGSASYYIANTMTGDAGFFDAVKVKTGDRILSLLDNAIYEVNASSRLTLVSSSNNDYVNVLSGLSYQNNGFIKTTGSFTNTKLIRKIVHRLDNN